MYRLEEIAKDGKYCKRLEKEKVFTVEDFLKALNKDPNDLVNVNSSNLSPMESQIFSFATLHQFIYVTLSPFLFL